MIAYASAKYRIMRLLLLEHRQPPGEFNWKFLEISRVQNAQIIFHPAFEYIPLSSVQQAITAHELDHLKNNATEAQAYAQEASTKYIKSWKYPAKFIAVGLAALLGRAIRLGARVILITGGRRISGYETRVLDPIIEQAKQPIAPAILVEAPLTIIPFTYPIGYVWDWVERAVGFITRKPVSQRNVREWINLEVAPKLEAPFFLLPVWLIMLLHGHLPWDRSEKAKKRLAGIRMIKEETKYEYLNCLAAARAHYLFICNINGMSPRSKTAEYIKVIISLYITPFIDALRFNVEEHRRYNKKNTDAPLTIGSRGQQRSAASARGLSYGQSLGKNSEKKSEEKRERIKEALIILLLLLAFLALLLYLMLTGNCKCGCTCKLAKAGLVRLNKGPVTLIKKWLRGIRYRPSLRHHLIPVIFAPMRALCFRAWQICIKLPDSLLKYFYCNYTAFNPAQVLPFSGVLNTLLFYNWLYFRLIYVSIHVIIVTIFKVIITLTQRQIVLWLATSMGTKPSGRGYWTGYFNLIPRFMNIYTCNICYTSTTYEYTTIV